MSSGNDNFAHKTPQHQIVLWGAGGQAKVLMDCMRRAGHRLEAVVTEDGQGEFAGIKIRDAAALKEWCSKNKPEQFRACVAIGGAHGKERLRCIEIMRELGLAPLTLVHETATLLDGSKIGEGSQILAGSVVGVEAQLGTGVIVNTGATIDHDSTVGDGSHISPGSVVLGRVNIGERVFVGANSTIMNDINICSDVTIGCGSVALKDIVVPGVYVGAPLRKIA